MSDLIPPTEPQRKADIARLELTKLRVDNGVTLETVFRRVTETAAEILNVERVGVWLVVDEGRALRCVDLFERSRDTHSTGITLQKHDFPDYFTALERRKTVPAEVAVSDPRTSELAESYLAPLGISSMLDASIYVSGQLVGVVCHEHVGPAREWTTEERDFAGSMADLLALKIRSAELQDARIAMRTQAAQLAEARRLDSIAELAAGVAHDFNNILTVMTGGAEMILLQPTSLAVAEYAQQIASAGERGKALAEELMSIARPGPRSSRVVRPAEVIKAQTTFLQTAVGDLHPIHLEVRTTTGQVLIAPDQLERLVLNLVINARDAMPGGGAILITLDTAQAPDENGKLGRYFLLEVRDQGTGIPPDVLPRIFDPFFTTKPRGQGTGLGLAVVHQIVNYAGGFIRVDTALGKGSTFRIYLPWVSSHG